MARVDKQTLGFSLERVRNFNIDFSLYRTECACNKNEAEKNVEYIPDEKVSKINSRKREGRKEVGFCTTSNPTSFLSLCSHSTERTITRRGRDKRHKRNKRRTKKTESEETLISSSSSTTKPNVSCETEG